MAIAATYDRYLEALLAGDRAACSEVVRDLLDQGVEVPQLYTELFQASLYRVGELWETGAISVADEHLATAVTEYLLSLVYPRLPRSARPRGHAVISCVATEYHQIGGRMVADLLEAEGWTVRFLGANTPLDDLLHALDDRRPDLVGLSLAIAGNLGRLEQALRAITAAHPDLPVLVGGQAMRWSGEHLGEICPQITRVTSAADLPRVLAVA